MVSDEQIKQDVNDWVQKYLINFTFRPYQEEYIIKTLSSILNDNVRVNVIEAPTGSGKSILVMIMAGVLDKAYEKKSYILCSDLYLWNQYAESINKFGLYFGKIKGAMHNYTCDQSGEDISLAQCKLAGISYGKLFSRDWCYENGWYCAAHCEYVKERYKALKSNVTLMTYQLYFPYMCDEDLQTGDEYTSFTPRDVVFCDECHNVPALCQQYCTISFDLHKDCNRFKAYLEFCKDEQIILEGGVPFKDFDINEYMNTLLDSYEKLKNTPYNRQSELYEAISELYANMQTFAECQAALDKNYKSVSSKGKRKKLLKREYIALDMGKQIMKLYNAIKIYKVFAHNYIDYIVKTDNMVPDPMNYNQKIWPDNPVVSLKFAKEDVLVHKCILKNQPYTVMLSATVGDHCSFDDNIGTKLLDINESNMMYIPSTFDFSKSPIYYIPGNKMSQEFINVSMPVNASIINKILKSDKHICEKGIIHTGSYKNAYDLLKLLDPDVRKRIYIYGASNEKLETLDKYRRSKNGVLIGPTLTEGIDFPNDGCRFIIILKIPYPYLGDNLVKAKLSLFPRWYNSETSNNVIQGIGRGNRTPDDWSTTYILDGSFTTLYQETRLQYPKEMRDRINLITLN
ncbi:MAG: DNA helicase [Wendovervirus sonii]|uniref:DNA helicase n=1 Tax=phage Lak_Megaphage_Sonny TaxID=3109229 RepID=A0ABZ0Z254_9CAUD|nr:MAG: DNA helicase [phage Lak_Megaphage_Sonny]